MEAEVLEALEVAAGGRLDVSGSIDRRRTVSQGDVDVTRKTILLFLESLDEEMTVAELRHFLE